LFEEIDDLDRFDLIYFDAFGYRVQPELWSTAIFKKCMMHSKQWRTSYLCCSWCSKRSMIEVGFKVEISRSPGKEKCFVQENSSEFVVTINFSEKWFDTIK
jgi:hypothetical protein